MTGGPSPPDQNSDRSHAFRVSFGPRGKDRRGEKSWRSGGVEDAMKDGRVVDEVEPCLRHPHSQHAPLAVLPFGGSTTSQLSSSVSRRKAGFARKCIIVLLIHAIFVFAILIAFLIGQWISEEKNKTPQTSNQNLTPNARHTNPPRLSSTTAHTVRPSPTLLTTSFLQNAKSSPRTIERLIPLRKEKNYTLFDVHPSTFENFELSEKLHGSHSRKKGTDALLVPLPLYILPVHYDLTVDLSNFDTTLTARANITIELESYGNSTEDEIQFHVGSNVRIERMRLRKNGSRVYPRTFKREESKKLARILLREALTKGRYVLEIEYNMTICDDVNDGVRCSLDSQTNSSLLATSFTTMFEPTLARTFFPCWDEPGIKATFNISVLHAEKYTVLSNMPSFQNHHRRDPYRIVTTTFQRTPPISTYLIAFAVGEFVKLETRTERGVALTVWTYPEDLMSLQFALDYAPLVFDRFEDTLEVPFSLPKVDLVAARNVHTGGMENWGLIVFEHASVAHNVPSNDHVNETVDRMYSEYRIGRLVGHEVAHQWFGNLVTMRDWSELWLNEGFATFSVHELMSTDHPKIAEFEYYDNLQRLFDKQSKEDGNLALVRELATESAVDESFHPTNLYTKGCVVIRMIRDLVSDFDFKAGVRRYLRRFAYRSVARDDLFNSLPAYADHGAEQEKLSDVLEGWFVNEGLPEVTAIRNYDNDMMTIRLFLRDRKSDFRGSRELPETFRTTHLLEDDVFMRDFGMKTTERRGTREALPDDTTAFDDSLFDGFVRETQKPKRRKHRPTRKKSTRAPPRVPPQPMISVSARREELRKPRRAGEPADLWNIPLSYMFGSLKTTEGQVVREFWLKNRSVSFADGEISPSQSILLNPDWKYPYRVNYDLHNWKLLARILHQNHVDIPEKSRMQIIVDSEFFLANSNNPHLYLYILDYLSQETKLDVMLFRNRRCSSGTSINSAILLYFTPVIRQMDKLLADSQTDAETAVLWLVRAGRLAKLYQLRCAANLPSCKEEYHTQRWSRDPDAWTEDVHKQVTAVCHHLFTHPDNKKINDLLENRLNADGSQWTLAVQLAACSKDQRIVKMAAKMVVRTKNAAVYASCLQSDFSLHYNPAFREAMWSEIGLLSPFERTLLFSTNKTEVLLGSRVLLHSVKTIDELRQVRSLISDWGRQMSVHLEYLERYLQWVQTVSRGVLHKFFSADLANL
ncbi:unnamed protein product [Caenorhabditis auriculariae]|uniref:Aminopeptidase n=1 Tax=Caenorhabditis auriculariae TaxID=2777116 RepID=A0A8S1HGN0_9PELO|nr:unnamed protein product [Caenorhabditis auriculariae]